VSSYRVQVWNTDTDFSPSTLIAEFENPKNLGYAAYLNDIGEAFFTISQYDPKVNIRSVEGKAHVFIIRDDGTNQDVVWRGILAEHDANARDVVFYAYGYEHLLHSLYTKWNHKWRNEKIAGDGGRPINELWIRAKQFNKSPVQWITSGTFQAPVTVSNGSVQLVLNRYRANWKRIITVMKELVAVATSDTDNIVYLEIDYPVDPTDQSATFNFWKDRSSDATDIRLEWGGVVMDFNDRFTPVDKKNQTLGVGTGPRNQLYYFTHKITDGTFGRNTFGLRQQNMYLSWVRDRKELKRIVRRRTRLGLREDVNMWVRCFPDTIPPYRATNSSHYLGDRIYTDIQHGVTNVNKWLHFMGEQVVFVNGREYVQPMLEDRSVAQSAFDGMTWHGKTSSTPWRLQAPLGTGSSTKSVTIDDDVKIVMLMLGTEDVIYNNITITPTLDGVAGTLAVRESGGGVFDKSAQIFYWNGADTKSGETVDLVINYSTGDSDGALAWGLLTANSALSVPALLDTDSEALASGNGRVTIDSGAVAGIGVVVLVKREISPYTPHSGSTRAVNAAPIDTKDFEVYYTTSSDTGSRIVGGDGNEAHVVVGAMFSDS
jgi:hypothetical protein